MPRGFGPDNPNSASEAQIPGNSALFRLDLGSAHDRRGRTEHVRPGAHAPILRRVPVIVAEEVQKPVREQVGDLTHDAAAVLGGLGPSRVEADHHVAEELGVTLTSLPVPHREREHVGRAILVTVVSVEPLDRSFVAEKHGELGVAHPQRFEHARRPRAHLTGSDGSLGQRACGDEDRHGLASADNGARELFERILIANRGEVGTRVARTCRRLGIETIGVHVGADENALHIEACDEAAQIGDHPSAYLDAARLVSTAKERGAHALHPGYGLLADEPSFTRAVESAGIVFVGPAADPVEAARDRLFVRSTAMEAGVRVLPASERPIFGPQLALEDVDRIGYPVEVRPVGGVGEPRERCVAYDVAELAEALVTLDPLEDHGGAYLEKHVELARHVEVQVIFDDEEAIVLGDREVTLRKGGRRVLSESPAPALDQLHHRDAVRGAIWEAASEVTSRLGCRGLASCHFVLDAEGTFFFSSFRPGLQVEHPTIEMCSGIDLVEMQLRLAAGEPMPPELRTAETTGAALQARIDAAIDPETGLAFESHVKSARWPPAPQGTVRIETGVRVGSVISPELDPLVATVTTHAPNRHDALFMLDRILAEIHLSPLVTNLRLLRKVLNHHSLQAGQYDEGFIERI